MDDWRFDENPEDHETYDAAGVGKWSTASARTLGLQPEQHQNQSTGENTMTEVAKKEANYMTPDARVSYPNVFEPRAAKQGDKAKYSISLVFPKTFTGPKAAEQEKLMAALKGAALAAAAEKWGADRSKWPKNLQSPFRDGAEKADKEGYGADKVFISVSSDYKPGVVDQDVKPIIDRGSFYAGCWARVTVAPYAWTYMGKNGVSFGLRNIQKLRDDVPFSGVAKPEDDFDAIPLPPGGVPAGAADPFAAGAAGAPAQGAAVAAGAGAGAASNPPAGWP